MVHELLYHPLSPLAAIPAASVAVAIAALARRAKGLTDEQRWQWRTWLFRAAAALWLTGLVAAAWLVGPVIFMPRLPTDTVSAGIRVAFWFSASAAIAAIAVDAATYPGRPAVIRPIGFWTTQALFALGALCCFGLYTLYNADDGPWDAWQKGRALGLGVACVVYVVGALALRAVNRLRGRHSPGAV